MNNRYLQFHLLMSLAISLTVSAQGIRVINATLGGNALLPCSSPDRSDVSIYWTFGENDKVVHNFYKGEDDLVDQERQFQGRTLLSEDKIKRGDFSLTVNNVTEADSGVYTCLVLEQDTAQKIQLEVQNPPQRKIDPDSKLNNSSRRVHSGILHILLVLLGIVQLP